MRYLICILALFALPAQAQIAQVTGDSVVLSLPNGEAEYSRDVLAISDEWAMDDIHLAMLIAEQEGQEIDVPPFASDSLINALTDIVDEALAREDSLIAVADGFQGQIDEWANLVDAYQDSLVEAQNENEDLRAQRDSLAVPAAQYGALAEAVRGVIEALK